MSSKKKSAKSGKKATASSKKKMFRSAEAPAPVAKVEEAPPAPVAAPEPKPKKEKTPKPDAAPKTPSLIDHAENILRAAKTEMHCPDIVAEALKEGWTTNGKTPGATLHAAISREIKEKGAESRFVKGSERGTFTLA